MIRERIPYDVTLSKGHLDICREEAEHLSRNAEKINARSNQYSSKFSQYDANFTAALGEFATSSLTGLPTHFGEPYKPGRADVGLIEVRTRSKGKEPILRLYETDRHDFSVLAVIRELSEDGAVIRLEGWCFTHQGISYGTPVGRHWKKGIEYALSTNFLHPMDTLLREHQQAERVYKAWADSL
jgi:hypothetical protein